MKISKEAKEKASEIYMALRAVTKVLSTQTLISLSIEVADMLETQAKETFHKYGLGFMGKAIARNDFKKSYQFQFWKEVKHELRYNMS